MSKYNQKYTEQLCWKCARPLIDGIPLCPWMSKGKPMLKYWKAGKVALSERNTTDITTYDIQECKFFIPYTTKEQRELNAKMENPLYREYLELTNGREYVAVWSKELKRWVENTILKIGEKETLKLLGICKLTLNKKGVKTRKIRDEKVREYCRYYLDNGYIKTNQLCKEQVGETLLQFSAKSRDYPQLAELILEEIKDLSMYKIKQIYGINSYMYKRLKGVADEKGNRKSVQQSGVRNSEKSS